MGLRSWGQWSRRRKVGSEVAMRDRCIWEKVGEREKKEGKDLMDNTDLLHSDILKLAYKELT